MNATHFIKVYRVGFASEPVYEGIFNGTDFEAERHASEMWDKHTPSDGTGFRLTLRRAGERRIMQTIG